MRVVGASGSVCRRSIRRCGRRRPPSAAIVGAELDEQQPAASRQQFEVRRALAPQPVDHRAFESLEADRTELQNLRHVIGGRKRIR